MTEKRSIPNRREIFRGTVLAVVFLTILWVVVDPFGHDLRSLTEGINVTIQEVNIKTGLTRERRILWWCEVSAQVEETELSKALNGETVDVVPGDGWHRVNTFHWGHGPSPHHRFHGAICQIHTVVSLWFELGLDTAARHESAKKLLRLWQAGGGDHAANSYVDELNRLAAEQD